MFVIMSKKQYRRDKMITYGAIGASSAIGIAGTTIGTIALVKTSKVKRDVDTFHTDMERRLSAEEGMTRQFTKAVSQIQDVLEKNDMMRTKR